MAVNGQRIENPEHFGYMLDRNNTHIVTTIPIGASGGRLKVNVIFIKSNNMEADSSWYTKKNAKEVSINSVSC